MRHFSAGCDCASAGEVMLAPAAVSEKPTAVLRETVFDDLDIGGLDIGGLDIEGLDIEGLDIEGLDIEGLDIEGLDIEGLDIPVPC
jgi:hypothetical protein